MNTVKDKLIHPFITNIANGDINLNNIHDNDMFENIVTIFDIIGENLVWNYDEKIGDIDSTVIGLRYEYIFDFDDVKNLCDIICKGSMRRLLDGYSPSARILQSCYDDLDVIKSHLDSFILTKTEKECQYTLEL